MITTLFLVAFAGAVLFALAGIAGLVFRIVGFALNGIATLVGLLFVPLALLVVVGGSILKLIPLFVIIGIVLLVVVAIGRNASMNEYTSPRDPTTY